MSRVEQVALAPEIVELVGHAAFPLVESLDGAFEPGRVAGTTLPRLEMLVGRTDLPRELQRPAQNALGAARGFLAGDRKAYASFLRAMQELLVRTGLPAPAELSD